MLLIRTAVPRTLRALRPLTATTTHLTRPTITTSPYKAIDIKGIRKMSDIKKIHTANACPRMFQLIAEMQKER